MESAGPGTPRDTASCPECAGTGFVLQCGPDGDAARPCACRLGRRDELRRTAARIPERYRHCTFDDFAPHYADGRRNPFLQRALELSYRVVAEYGVTPDAHGLLLVGPCGVGKTHLAVSILRALVESKGAVGLFAEFNDLLRRIQETYDRRSETPSWAVLQPTLDADVLVLDDLGAARMTPWVLDTVSLIVNERYNSRRLTILTSNRLLKPTTREESLQDRIGGRLFSRIAEMCWIAEIEGDDFRLRNR
ncbi:MAG: ATP-binding protein [Acidobacteria bacterium]|nr:ATP-binding protein [Acidobacteriota bacterium]